MYRFGEVTAIEKCSGPDWVGTLEVFEQLRATCTYSSSSGLSYCTANLTRASHPICLLTNTRTVFERIVQICLQPMLLVDVPSDLIGHHTYMTAIHPVFQCVILIEFAVTARQNSTPKSLQIGISFFSTSTPSTYLYCVPPNCTQ